MRRAVCLLLLGILAGLPVAAGQTPVDGCSRQCVPTDPDVNDPPVRSEGPANVILYAHFFGDLLGWAPMNVQPVVADHEPTFEKRYAVGTVYAPPALHFGAGQRVEMMPSATLITHLADGTISLGHGYGAFDMAVADGPIVLYAYYAAETSPAGPQTDAGAVPLLRFEAAWVAHDRNTSRDLTLASGRSSTFTMINHLGLAPVYEVRIELERHHRPDVARCTWHRCRIAIWPVQVDAGRAAFAQGDIQAVVGPEFPWRIILPAAEPLRTEALDSSLVDDAFWLQWHVSAAVGSYDINDETALLQVIGPDGLPGTVLPPTIIKHSTDHYATFMPARFIWKVPIGDDALAPGTRLKMMVGNLEGTYLLAKEVQLDDMLPKPVPAMPGVGAISTLLLAALAGLLLPGVGRRVKPL